jgi:site-specific recombinase XerD
MGFDQGNEMTRNIASGSVKPTMVCRSFGGSKIRRASPLWRAHLARVANSGRRPELPVLSVSRSAWGLGTKLLAKPEQIYLNRRHALKAAAVTGQSPVRDVALLLLLYGTGLTPNEAGKLLISDYLEANGAVRVQSTVRAEIAFNGKARLLIWASSKIRQAIDDYLAYRLAARQGVTTTPSAYRGLDAYASLFRASDGKPFTFTRRVTGSGAVSYSCETLTEIVRRLHQQAGIEGGNRSAARRTFAVRLHRDGRSLKLIQQLLGVSSLSAVKNLIQGDPVRLSSIVSGVI